MTFYNETYGSNATFHPADPSTSYWQVSSNVGGSSGSSGGNDAGGSSSRRSNRNSHISILTIVDAVGGVLKEYTYPI